MIASEVPHMNTQHSAAALYIAAVITLCGFYLQVVRMGNREVEAAKSSIAADRAQIGMDQAVITRAVQLHRVQQQIRRAIGASLAPERSAESNAMLLGELSTLARGRGVIIESVLRNVGETPGSMSDKLRAAPLRLSITGRFNHAIAFVAGVAGFKSLVSVQKLDVRRAKSLKGEAVRVRVQIDLAVYSIRERTTIRKEGVSATTR